MNRFSRSLAAAWLFGVSPAHAGSSLPPAPSIRTVLLSATPSLTFSQRIFERGTTAISNRTFLTRLAMASSHQWVRIQYCNGSATPYTIDKTYAQGTNEIFRDTANRIAVGASIASATGATGWAVNDTANLVGGTSTTVAQVVVTDVDAAGKPLGFIVNNHGAYSVAPTGTVTLTAPSGAGTNAGSISLNVTWKNGLSAGIYDSTDTLQTMVPVYFNTVAAAVAASKDPTQIGIDPTIYDPAPGVQTGTTASVSVPAGTTALPACVRSDWTLVPSTARKDGDARPYLAINSYCSGTCAALVKNDTYSWDDPAINLGRDVISMDVGGDQSSSTNPSFASSNRLIVSGVQAIGEKPVQTVLACGDSLTQGHQGHNSYSTGATYEVSSAFKGPWHIASALISTPANPVAYWNSGWTAQTTAQFFARCVREIPYLKPSVAIIAAYSPNDAGVVTVANAKTGFARATALALLAQANGGIPILWTPLPSGGKALGSYDDGRLWVVNAVKASGFRYIDPDALLTDGNYPANLTSTYNSGDDLHPNEAGYNLEASGVRGGAQVVQQIMGN